MIHIFGVGTSRSLRVHWAMKEAGVEYVTVPVKAGSEESKGDEYKNINMTSKIPAADFDGHHLTESCAIIKYIGNKYKKDLVGKDLVEESRIDEWLFFLLSELDAHTMYIIDKHAGTLSHIFGKSPEAAKTAVNGFNEQIVKLETGLEGKTFLTGDRLTVADIMAVTCLIWARKLIPHGVIIPEACLEYADIIMERPQFKEAWKVNYA
jgi:glutathione S-transferase